VRHSINSNYRLTIVCFLTLGISSLITVLIHKLKVETKEGQESKKILFAYFAFWHPLYSVLCNFPIPHRFLSEQSIFLSRPLFLCGAFQLLSFEILQGLSLDRFFR